MKTSIVKVNFLILLLLTPYFLFAESKESGAGDFMALKNASQILVFKNIYVFSSQVGKDALLGNLINDAVFKKMVSLGKFKIFNKTLLSKDLLKTGLTHVDINNRKVLFKMNFLNALPFL